MTTWLRCCGVFGRIQAYLGVSVLEQGYSKRTCKEIQNNLCSPDNLGRLTMT